MWERISPFIGLAVFGIVIYLCFMIAPPYFNNWQFQDFIESEARLDTYNTKPEQDIKKDVMKSARENNIPITEEKLVVVRSNVGVQISTAYVVHVDLPGYPLDLNFNPSSKNVLLTAPH
jgi:Domain of unknown function (DUF4845)